MPSLRDGLDPRVALALLPLCCWEAWRLLAGRFGDGLSAAPLALIGAAAAVPALRAIAAGRAAPVPFAFLTPLLACYLAAVAAGPALAVAGIAVAAIMLTCRRIAGDVMPWAPLLGLALLALPVLPSLEFYLAYPMRLICAQLAGALLRLNGIGVAVEGVAFNWNGTLLLFDAACSGIRMLWAALFLVSAIALAAGYGPGRYARAVAIAVAAAMAGNAVRAASLFYVENGFVERLDGPVGHEAVGIVSFLLLAAATSYFVAPRQWRPA